MKKFLALALAFCMIATSMVFVPLTVAAEDATITVNSVDSLNQAIKDIPNEGTIVVDGNIAFEDNTAHVIYLGSNTGKTYTIKGGTLDFTAVNTNANPAFINIHDNITFESITLAFDSEKNDYLFACGYNFTVAETVTFTGAKVCFYGGRYLHHNTVNKDKSINVTLLAGSYTSINGTSHASGYTVEGDVNITVGGYVTATSLNGGTGKNAIGGSVNIEVRDHADIKNIIGAGDGVIEGDVYVTVKDYANPQAAPSDDSHNGGGYYIFGGGSGTVKGSTYVKFMDNAKSGYVVGGTNATSGSIGGTANVYITGDTKTYSVYGCGTKVAADAKVSANIVIDGGEVWQVFGGAESTGGDSSSKIDGNITIKLLGGTVWRRVFGGSYNETKIFSWSSSHYVKGIITLVIGEKVTLKLNDGSDYGLSAQSRRNGVASGENGVVIYANSTVKNNTKMDNGSANGATHQTAHVYSYALNGNVITQTCSEHSSHSATATITPAGNTYTGEAINVAVEYSDNWEFEQFNVTYANNVNGGTATATLSIEGITTQTYPYDINKLSQKAPAIKIVDGKIIGLTTEMEYSTDGKTFRAVTADTVLSGKFFVRYQETASLYASPSVILYTGIDLSINNVSGRAGDTVEVIVYAPQYNGGALELTVGYDKEALTLTSATNGDVLGGFDHNGDTLTWSAASANAKKGTFVKLYFTINDGATGSYTVSVEGENITAQAGSITVVEYVCGDIAVNGEESDGKIGVDDIMALRYALADDGTGALSAGADVNGDNVVDSRDVVILRQYIANYDFDAGESTITLGGN